MHAILHFEKLFLGPCLLHLSSRTLIDVELEKEKLRNLVLIFWGMPPLFFSAQVSQGNREWAEEMEVEEKKTEEEEEAKVYPSFQSPNVSKKKKGERDHTTSLKNESEDGGK